MWWLLPYYLHCFEHINQRHLGTAGRQAVVQYDSDVPCLRKLHRDVVPAAACASVSVSDGAARQYASMSAWIWRCTAAACIAWVSPITASKGGGENARPTKSLVQRMVDGDDDL